MLRPLIKHSRPTQILKFCQLLLTALDVASPPASPVHAFHLHSCVLYCEHKQKIPSQIWDKNQDPILLKKERGVAGGGGAKALALRDLANRWQCVVFSSKVWDPGFYPRSVRLHFTYCLASFQGRGWLGPSELYSALVSPLPPVHPPPCHSPCHPPLASFPGRRRKRLV